MNILPRTKHSPTSCLLLSALSSSSLAVVCDDNVTHRYIGQCGKQTETTYTLRNADVWPPGDDSTKFKRCPDNTYCCGQNLAATGRGITQDELHDNCTPM
ncbi:hypothetical protein PGT21_035160 [Puccinia graminis f. sp. tritici]|uniref:Hydrophobin n=1 Tax=Puccinia graminis f. sp. tritici TaxID=56615 RepID=A0A5B0MPX6_PUCGR|nr:hypothetical protein PGT21_035160 [Puccinia graminis f. sp. tritici]